MKQLLLPLLAPLVLTTGCASTHFTDTKRTATEQLLLSDAVDSALESIHFDTLAGRAVFFDATHLAEATDKQYVEASLRRKLARAGVRFSDKVEESEVVVKAAVGALGTNRSQSMLGIPQTALPGPFPAAVPEIAITKETEQIGVAKLFVFAYERATGALLADASSPVATSDYRAKWILGTGPRESGSAALPSAGGREDAPLGGLLDVLNPFSWFNDHADHSPGHSTVEIPYRAI